MTLRQFAFGTLFAGLGMFAVNALADDAAQATQPTTTTTTSTTTYHSTTKHHHAAKLDLNSADATTLAKIHGIGAKRAAAIVDYRSKNGPYKSVADLKNLTNAKGKPLFSDKALERLANRLTVSPAA